MWKNVRCVIAFARHYKFFLKEQISFWAARNWNRAWEAQKNLELYWQGKMFRETEMDR